MAWEFWIDRGGTFTDVVGLDPTGNLRTHKLLSENPELYADAAVQGIKDLIAPANLADVDIKHIKMGTTVATNALLERKGAKVALFITKGFRDLLIIGDQSRPDLFALNVERPTPLFHTVFEVPERLDAFGNCVRSMDEQAIAAAMKKACAMGCDAAAIAFLHAHKNPAHENTAAQYAYEAGFDQVSLSSGVSGLSKIVARGDTAVIDAYLSPVLRHYVYQVETALGDVQTALSFMQSNGGLTQAGRFSGKDAILSGPAGGIVGMAKTASAAGFDRVIGFDMGGTSTDVSHYNGSYDRTSQTMIAGARICVPMLEIHTVAAGGGSICTLENGRLQVGPHSAGANPGPASYGRGGPLTVTDCNVLLGRVSPDLFPKVFGPDGNAPLDVSATQAAFAELTQNLPSKTAEETAEGFLQIAVENMANAIKKITVERGHDVSAYALQCFGGAGGQHACKVAEVLGVKTILIHPFAGVLSAYGMGLADVREVKEAQLDCAIDDTDALQNKINALSDDVRRAVQGQDVSTINVTVQVYLNFEGAIQSLPVPFDTPQKMEQVFRVKHKARFGYDPKSQAVRVSHIAVEAVGKTGNAPMSMATYGSHMPFKTARMYSGAWQDVPVYQRADLDVGKSIKGPALIAEPTGTNVIEAGWEVHQDALGNLVAQHKQTQTQAPNTTQLDPIKLEVLSNRFMAIAEQMGLRLANTAWSVNIKERFDFSCAIFDVNGNLVANAPHVPVHLGSMSDSIRAVMRRFDHVKDGDAFMVNSPYEGGTHLPDVTVVTPVFYDGKLLCWVASRGHHADIGGRTPGSAPPDSGHIEEEGILIPPTQILRTGGLDENQLREIFTSGPYPCRSVDQNIADLKAQIAANEAGKTELVLLADNEGADGVQAYMGYVQDHAEDEVCNIIPSLKNGAFCYDMDTGQHIQVAVSFEAKRQKLCVDFTGTSAQHEGNYNAPLSVCRAVVLYVLRLLVGKSIPLNEGCLRAIDLIVPEGSMLNPRYPAAVIAGNTEVSQAICNALLGALGVQAGSQGTMNNFVWGNDQFQNYETLAGGTGAGHGFDGCSAVQSHMTNTRATDPEVLEKRFPVCLEEFSIAHGTGRAGVHKGGDGLLRKLRFLQGCTVTTLTSSRLVAPFGLNGGQDGTKGKNWVEWSDGRIEHMPGNCEVHLPENTVFAMQTPGGGGFGTPKENQDDS